jgi:alkyl hydroperoxide reductase subunit D
MLEAYSDQVLLLKHICLESELSGENLLFSAWAAALATKNHDVSELVKRFIGEPSNEQRQAIEYSVARMSVTNPYFVSRQYVEINAGGTLASLKFRPLAELNIGNETAYHFACVAVSLVNGGHICLQSHVGILKAQGEPDLAIDAAMRLAATCHSSVFPHLKI